MAKNMIFLMVSAALLIETCFIISSNAAPMVILAFPLHQESPLSPSAITEEVKRVHRREVMPIIISAEKESEAADEVEPEDDLETAAGTNLLRPLFVYRQQMAYRDRQSKRAAHRRAVSVF